MRGSAVRLWDVARSWPPIADDPYLFYTTALVPIVMIVASITREDDMATATVLGAVTLIGQVLLGVVGRRQLLHERVSWQLVRLLPPLAFVAVASLTVGGPSLPLVPLFILVVAAAAAAGTVQGAVTTTVAVAVLLIPEVASLATQTGIGLRGVTLAGVTLVVAFGTRRVVLELERSATAARSAVHAERTRAGQISALESVGGLLAAGGETPVLIERVVDVIVHRFGYPRVSVYLGDADLVHLAAQRGYEDAAESFDSRTGIAGRVMRSRELAFVADAGSDPDYVPGAQPPTSLICAPLIADDRFLGLLSVDSTSDRQLDETDRSLVVIMATRIASAVALGQDRQALSARADLFRDVEAFGRDVTSSLAVDSLAEMMIEAIDRVVTADVLAVSLLDRENGRYVIRAARGLLGVVGHVIQVGDGLAGRAIRDRVIVIDNALTPEQFPQSIQDLHLPTWNYGVGLPLVRDGVVVGAISIGRTTGTEGFTALELEGLQLLASSAALAVANAFLHAEVAELAVRDPLTGLYNRRHFDEALDRVLAVHRRERLSGRRPLSAIMFDLDRFGLFNKEHGHQVGDIVLKAFADVLAARFRASDLLARIGGEEFIVVLDGADRQAAVIAADEVRAMLAERSIRAEDGTELRVTVSAGCAELDPGDPTRESLLRTADVALFMAKRAGRDRVVAA
jgi:diguanylate cyclase (GGDEF)-like protein